MRKKLLIIGHARHGKDTVAQIISDVFGYSFKSSSEAASEIFIYETLRKVYGYQTPQECFDDRVNHRSEWHDLISDYNKEDKARLAKEILKKADIYVGMRADAEVEACLSQGIFDYVIGVYDPRKTEEPRASFSIDIWSKSDFLIANASSIKELRRKVIKLKTLLV